MNTDIKKVWSILHVKGLRRSHTLWKSVLRCWALDEDLQRWDAGDLSEIGERGVTLR